MENITDIREIAQRAIAAHMEIEQANKMRVMQELASVAESGKTVFIGDSITEGFPVGELLHNYQIYNRGISGDTTEQLIERLSITTYPLKPSKVFMLIGTNDIGQGRSVNDTANSIKAACKKIKENIGEVKLHLISVYPVNMTEVFTSDPRKKMTLAERSNELIIQLNEKIKIIASDEKAEYLDFYPLLTDERGNLKENYTYDGLHLNINGYMPVVKALKAYL